MDAQNVYMFAPNAEYLPKLEYVDVEIEAISKHHNLEVFRELERFDLVSIGAERERQDVYHFAGHLGEEGFALNSGYVSVATLIIAIKAAEPRLTVFNTCSSAALAQRIAAATTSDCIFTKTDVYDDRSAEFSIAFYAVLRRESVTSYLQACRIVDPQDNIFQYVSSRNARTDEVNEKPNTPDRLSDHIWQELKEVKDRIKAIETFLSGTVLGEPGLTAQVRGVKDDIRRIEREIELVDVLDSRLDKLDSRLDTLEGMLSYSTRTQASVYIFYAVIILLAAAVAIAFLVTNAAGN
jgi:hypothetical protein